MRDATRWLVCSGAGEFLSVAAVLIAAGFAGEIEWEPVPARACARIARPDAGANPMGAVVSGGGLVADPGETARALASSARGGRVVLCVQKAQGDAEPACPPGVEAVVEPSGLLDYLLHGTRGKGAEAEGAADAGAACDGAASAETVSRGESASGGTMPDGSAPDEPVPDEIIDAMPQAVLADIDHEDLVAGACRAAAWPWAGERPGPGADQTAPLRASGRLPRVGVADGLGDWASFCDTSIEEPFAPGDALSAPPADSRAGKAVDVAVLGERLPGFADEGEGPAGLAEDEEVEVGAARMRAPAVELSEGMGEAHVPTLCFASARGGVGKSALAALTAVTLARDGLTVALVDLDYQFGTCLGYLGAEETDGLLDAGAVPSRIRLDGRLLARCRAVPEGRLAAYEFCRFPEQAEVLAPLSGHLLRAARRGADVAVVDLPTGVNETVAQALELCDRCLLVGDQRALSLESLSAQQELCVRMGIPRTKLVCVMNRCDARHRDEGFLSRVRFQVQTPQIVRVADGGSEVMQMLAIGSAGELATMRNRFALSVADLAHGVCADLGCRPSTEGVDGAVSQRMWVKDEARPGRRRKTRRDKREEAQVCPL